jgi:hypothetical protein
MKTESPRPNETKRIAPIRIFMLGRFRFAPFALRGCSYASYLAKWEPARRQRGMQSNLEKAAREWSHRERESAAMK